MLYQPSRNVKSWGFLRGRLAHDRGRLSHTVESMGRRPARQRQGRLAGLSRRRRILVGAVAVLAGAGLAAGISAVIAARGQSGGPLAGQPGHDRAGQTASRPAQDRPGPVLLVPGYGGGTSALDWLAGRIRATGRTAIVLHLPGTGTGSLVTDAAVLNVAVSQALDAGAPSVDVIGYSAGGVVALIWARHDDGAAKARRVITLGSPFHGTVLASDAQAFIPGACPVACQQLIPNSRLLTSLAAGNPTGLPRWLSLWTTDDATVKPPDSARLAGAINVPVQSLCPAARINHSELPTNPLVAAIVLGEIGSGPLRYPSPADCRRGG
jgi:triacylglycerol lipase